MFGRPDRPDAVFVANDHMAFAVIDVLRDELGLGVPQDVAVVGYDDVPPAAWAAYALSTVRQRANAMVEATVRLLLARIEDPAQPAGTVTIESPLVLRRTTRPLD
jgi:DNA-binding LacI/PurR family transcriptional regulator